MGGGESSPAPPPAPSCQALTVCDTFSFPGLGNGSSCDTNAWASDWILIGNASLPGDEVRLQEHRFNSQAARYVDVQYALPVVTTLSFDYATTNVEATDTAAVGISVDNGTTWTILHEYDGILNSNGTTIATDTFDISAWAAASQILIGFNVTNEYQEDDEFFHVRNVTIQTYCTPSPTALPTAAPTASPTASPTAAPTASPTAAPTAAPTASPTAEPTASPTAAPTTELTASPTAAPTASPTAAPTAAPTASPTAAPTAAPTASPTATPTASLTASPTAAPTASPTAEPTASPTAAPTSAPTASPTAAPTASPTAAPTASPTVSPTAAPTFAPTASPTPVPTLPTIPPRYAVYAHTLCARLHDCVDAECRAKDNCVALRCCEYIL